ncbi:LIM/homeobox protein Lhx9-like isoform X1 [Pleurodeles waltl]|uniref:LIM/homeobox protein Lhx9-like isoform X1 n=1 Tax=Pleurodeles waltl TaxID=8319 RepID=UPI0037099D5E
MAGGYGFCYSAMLFQGFPEGDMVENVMDKGPQDLRLPTNRRSMQVPAAASCAGCGAHICDRYFLFAVDRHWHLSCLKCCMCQLPLGSELTCFSKDGGIYCKTDYYRRFSVNRCAKCHAGIASSEMVMKAREAVYHVGCFSCLHCGVALRTGDLFGLREGELYCHRHCQAMGPEEEQEQEETDLGPPTDSGLLVTDRLPPADTHTIDISALALLSSKPQRKGRGRRRRSYGGAVGLGICTPESEDGEHSPELRKQRRPRQPQQPRIPKVKRVRTSFKNHQLRTMESYFSVKHNPDGKDWEQLAKKTGLPKRVLQVWFQNARAKLRKSLSQEGSPEMGCSADTPEDHQTSPESPVETFSQSPEPIFSLQDFSTPYPSLPKASFAPMMPIYLNYGLKEAGPTPPPYC